MGRAITALVLITTLGLSVYVIWRLDTAPRTDDAYVYADTIAVTPEVSGRIVDLAVEDNQLVKKGDVLFRIDPRPFEETLAKAQATLTSLDKEIVLTQRTVDAQKVGASASAAIVDRARAAAQQSHDTLARMEPLLPDGYVSAEQLDQARTADRGARSQLEAAQLDARRAAVGVGGVDALVAKRDVVQAEIALAKLNLEYATVRAPFDGRVIGLRTSTGQFAAAGHPIFSLANTNRWYVIANFRESELAHIRPGQPVQTYVLSDSSRRFAGIVESIGFGVFPDDGGGETAGLPHVPRSINWVRVAQRFPVRIRIDKPDPELFRIGASAVAIMGSAASTQDRKTLNP